MSAFLVQCFECSNHGRSDEMVWIGVTGSWYCEECAKKERETARALKLKLLQQANFTP